MAASPSILATLLSAGLVFSVATQLRYPGLSAGFGEVLLALWLLMSVGQPSNWRSSQILAVGSLVFIGGSMLFAGYLATYPVGHERPPALHDVLAYTFCAVLAINFLRLKETDIERMPILFVLSFLASSIIALVLGGFSQSWTGMSIFYGEGRWQHLSVNPNQFALMVLAVPFLAIHSVLRRADRKWLAVAVGVLAVILGVWSASDALSVAWIGGGGVALATLFGTHASQDKRIAALLIVAAMGGAGWQLSNKSIMSEAAASSQTSSPAGGRVQAQEPGETQPSFAQALDTPVHNLVAQDSLLQETPLQTMASAHGFFDWLKIRIPCDPGHVDGEKTQVNVRFCLWRHALDAIEQSPVTGWGPGPHSGISAPFAQEEAHNTWLDWATQSGMVGATALTLCILWIFVKLLDSGSYESLGLFVALICFSMFHHTLRQPLFWLLPLILLRLSKHAVEKPGKIELNPARTRAASRRWWSKIRPFFPQRE